MSNSLKRIPWWLWLNIMSLDAPLVAVAWLWMLTKAWRVQYFPSIMYVILAGVVWCIYIADRLVDVRIRERRSWSVRHEVHERHQGAFMLLWALVALGTLGLGLREFRFGLLWYLVPALLLCGIYAVLVVRSSQVRAVSYGKNLVAGLAFSYGTALSAHFYLPLSGVESLLLSPVMLGFAVICMLNMTVIDVWEALERKDEEEGELEVYLVPVLGVMGLFSLMKFLGARAIQESLPASFAGSYYMDELFMGFLISSAGLLVLMRLRNRMSIEALRVWGDLVLLIPVFLFIVN